MAAVSDDGQSTASNMSFGDFEAQWAQLDMKALKSGGHRRCWKFMTHPEGWIDNIGVLTVIVVPVSIFTFIMKQETFPAIFMLGTCNIISICLSLLLLVPASRDLSTYKSLQTLTRLLNYDKRMSPNSWRHMFILGSWIFQLLVLGAVVLTECRILLELFVPEARVAPSGTYSLAYKLADSLSSSLLGNFFTLALTTFSSTFFGFSWFVGCFDDR